MYNLPISINNFKNIHKKVKLISCNLNIDKSNFKILYTELKEFYKIKIKFLSLNTDKKKNLIYFIKEKNKLKISPFFYTTLFFPEYSINSRFLVNLKFKKKEFLLIRFEKFIKKLNKLNCFNLILNNLINKRNNLLFNCFITKIGNYNSGYSLCSYGFKHFFLYYKKICLTKLSFISKYNYFILNFKLFKLKIFKLFKNSFNRYKQFFDNLFFKKNNILTLNKILFNLLKEFLKLKRILRIYYIFIFKFVPPYQGKFERLTRISKIYLYFYYFIITKIYKYIFYNCLYLLKIFNNNLLMNINNISFIILNLYNLNIFNLNILKFKIFNGIISNFIKGKIIKLRSTHNYYTKIKKLKNYKYILKYRNIKSILFNIFKIIKNKDKFFKKLLKYKKNKKLYNQKNKNLLNYFNNNKLHVRYYYNFNKLKKKDYSIKKIHFFKDNKKNNIIIKYLKKNNNNKFYLKEINNKNIFFNKKKIKYKKILNYVKYRNK